MSRRKKLRKGIDSIGEQIMLHKQKLEAAQKAGNIGLVDYYEKEISSMEAALLKKQAALEGK
jgi:hypothetical protein